MANVAAPIEQLPKQMLRKRDGSTIGSGSLTDRKLAIRQAAQNTPENPAQTEEQTTAQTLSGSGVGSAGTGGEVQAAGQGAAAPGAAVTEPSEAEQAAALADRSRETSAAYETALARLNEIEGKRPGYESRYDADIADLYAQITGRGDYNYSLEDDPLWQMYREDYTRLGKRAMQDTMGRAAALTGGYGSSYGQAAGQQAYDSYLAELMGIAPELEERAYQRWSDEGERMNERLKTLRDLEAEDYARFLDEDKRWQDERDFAAGQADAEYGRWLTERGYADNREALAYDRENDARELLVGLIAYGYEPTEQELREAGLNRKQYEAIAAQYAPQTPQTVYVPVGGQTQGTGSDPVQDDAAEGMAYLQYLRDQGYTPGSQYYQMAMRQLGYTSDPLRAGGGNGGR